MTIYLTTLLPQTTEEKLLALNIALLLTVLLVALVRSCKPTARQLEIKYSKALEDALEVEDYERAARLRDKINQIA